MIIIKRFKLNGKGKIANNGKSSDHDDDDKHASECVLKNNHEQDEIQLEKVKMVGTDGVSNVGEASNVMYVKYSHVKTINDDDNDADDARAHVDAVNATFK